MSRGSCVCAAFSSPSPSIGSWYHSTAVRSSSEMTHSRTLVNSSWYSPPSHLNQTESVFPFRLVTWPRYRPPPLSTLKCSVGIPTHRSTRSSALSRTSAGRFSCLGGAPEDGMAATAAAGARAGLGALAAAVRAGAAAGAGTDTGAHVAPEDGTAATGAFARAGLGAVTAAVRAGAVTGAGAETGAHVCLGGLVRSMPLTAFATSPTGSNHSRTVARGAQCSLPSITSQKKTWSPSSRETLAK
mmetsp:Transcript_32334/g.76336  ORF Transcript_32334/g.76336 Transcript_32334/m.76336 type:complete len:243 (-) Transcript_32334:303-1031(-)